MLAKQTNKMSCLFMKQTKLSIQEKQRFNELKAIFPDELKFVFSAFNRGLTNEQARIEYVKISDECVQGKDSGMENNIYKALKNGGCDAKMIITKYNNRSIEELASMLIEEMMRSWVGNIINIIDSRNESENCREAFKGALLRLLKEAKGENEDVKL